MKKEIKNEKSTKKTIKIILRRFLFYIICPLFFTVLVFLPMYQNIELDNFESDLKIGIESKIETHIKNLSFSFKKEAFGIVGINIPKNKHQLCLKNRNRVNFTDPNNNIFKTDDMTDNEKVKEGKVGAMKIILNYFDESKDSLYREIGQNTKCNILDVNKLGNFASSTVEYKYMSIYNTSEFDLDGSKVALMQIVGNSNINANSSKLFITPIWDYFIAVWIVLIIVWEKLVALIKKIFSIN